MKVKAITRTSEKKEIPAYFPGWLEERYPGHYAQISTVNTLRLKNAVRDVCRFKLGSVTPDIEYLAKGFQVPPQGITDRNFIFGYESDGGHVPGSIHTDKNLQEYIRKYPDHWEIVKEALSLMRSKGRHAAGYVISNEPIDEFIPTTQVSGVKVLDFTGPDAESVGALKMDFLVVSCLKDVQECVKLIQNRYLGGRPKDTIIDGKLVRSVRIVPDKQGKLLDIWDLPDDEEALNSLSKGNSSTIFQFDTNSARKWLKHFEGIINNARDMAIFTALDRPGPLDYMVTNPDNPSTKVNMLEEYARRAKGKKGSPDIVKEFDTLCAETKGIMVYQETLMNVYKYFTECTLSEAEAFRGYVGKKKKDKIEQCYSLFMQKAQNKVSKENAQEVWNSIITFAAYSFNKSHAQSYASLGYACLWLKHNYTLEWWNAILINATKDEINEKFWLHCGNLVLLPDISQSKGDWSIEGDKIRAPISLLTGMGEAAHKQLAKSAPYSDLKAFCSAIIEHQKSNPVTKEKLDTDGTVKKVTTWGRNALDIGKIHSMIISGVMDSLFDPNLTISEKVDLYHNTMKELYLAEGKKYVRSKKTLPNLDAIGRYQAKKEVLPPYGEDLRPLLVQTGLPDYIEYDKRAMRIKDKVYSKETGKEEDTFSSVVGAKAILDLETSQDYLDRYIRCGIVGYIEKKDSFYYKKEGNQVQAFKFIVEFGGLKKEFVMWPDYYGQINDNVKNVQVGSIVAAIIEKRKGKSDFSMRSLEVIRLPLDVEKVPYEPNKDDAKAEESN